MFFLAVANACRHSRVTGAALGLQSRLLQFSLPEWVLLRGEEVRPGERMGPSMLLMSSERSQ